MTTYYITGLYWAQAGPRPCICSGQSPTAFYRIVALRIGADDTYTLYTVKRTTEKRMHLAPQPVSVKYIPICSRIQPPVHGSLGSIKLSPDHTCSAWPIYHRERVRCHICDATPSRSTAYTIVYIQRKSGCL